MNFYALPYIALLCYYVVHNAMKRDKQTENQMDLTKERLAYSQQKNREFIYQQAKEEIMGKRQRSMSELEEIHVYERFKKLCKDANINPWGI